MQVMAAEGEAVMAEMGCLFQIPLPPADLTLLSSAERLEYMEVIRYLETRAERAHALWLRHRALIVDRRRRLDHYWHGDVAQRQSQLARPLREQTK